MISDVVGVCVLIIRTKVNCNAVQGVPLTQPNPKYSILCVYASGKSSWCGTRAAFERTRMCS